MKFHHHQLFFERIVLFIVIAPSGIVYSKTYAACQRKDGSQEAV